MISITNTFAKRLRELRVKQGFSQESFAKKTGIHRTYIASLETGKRNISLKNLEKIARGLNIGISELLKFNKTTPSTILLKIKDEVFLLECKQELDINTINEIEILCHSAHDEESEFNNIRKQKGYKEEFYEMDAYVIAEIFQKVVFEQLKIEVTFKSINLEVSVWL